MWHKTKLQKIVEKQVWKNLSQLTSFLSNDKNIFDFKFVSIEKQKILVWIKGYDTSDVFTIVEKVVWSARANKYVTEYRLRH